LEIPTLAGIRLEFEAANIILARGRGNFETRHDREKDIYFLLKAKCNVVAGELGVKKGAIIFQNSRINDRLTSNTSARSESAIFLVILNPRCSDLKQRSLLRADRILQRTISMAGVADVWVAVCIQDKRSVSTYALSVVDSLNEPD